MSAQATTPDAQAWRLDAACRPVLGRPTRVWFPDRGDRDAEEAAKAICQQCPVRQDCLDFALANREHHGIWGGLGIRDRERIRRRRRAALR